MPLYRSGYPSTSGVEAWKKKIWGLKQLREHSLAFVISLLPQVHPRYTVDRAIPTTEIFYTSRR